MSKEQIAFFKFIAHNVRRNPQYETMNNNALEQLGRWTETTTYKYRDMYSRNIDADLFNGKPIANEIEIGRRRLDIEL
jgi:hypothetical protein